MLIGWQSVENKKSRPVDRLLLNIGTAHTNPSCICFCVLGSERELNHGEGRRQDMADGSGQDSELHNT